jgi:chorismate-pyruvate lyase
VSAAEIIKALPNLSEADRRAIREVLLEIANQDPNIAACNQAALEGALLLDRMEDEDARRKSR